MPEERIEGALDAAPLMHDGVEKLITNAHRTYKWVERISSQLQLLALS